MAIRSSLTVGMTVSGGRPGVITLSHVRACPRTAAGRAGRLRGRGQASRAMYRLGSARGSPGQPGQELRGNPVRIRNCPAAVSENEPRHVHWDPDPGKRRAVGATTASSRVRRPAPCGPAPRDPDRKPRGKAHAHQRPSCPLASVFAGCASDWAVDEGRRRLGSADTIRVRTHYCAPGAHAPSPGPVGRCGHPVPSRRPTPLHEMKTRASGA